MYSCAQKSQNFYTRLTKFPGLYLHHKAIVKKLIRDYSLVQLIIVVADWEGDRTLKNPFTAQEACHIAEISTENLPTLVCPFPLKPHLEFTEQLRLGFIELGTEITVFSGSSATLTAANKILIDETVIKSLQIVDLNDDGLGPRSTSIREKIERDDTTWKDMVTPSAAKYIDSLNIQERLRSLERGNKKRPWA